MAYNEKLRITKALDGDRQLIDSKVYRVKSECALSVKVLSYTLNFQELALQEDISVRFLLNIRMRTS